MYTFKDNILKISVRNLVEFVCREGDIDNRHGRGADKNAMDAGSRAHRRIQKQMGSQYEAEVPMRMEFPFEEYTIVLEGRADGVITEEEQITIDEIKGTYRDLRFLEEPVAVHKAQAMCYAYMKCVRDGLDRIGIMMTYVNLDTDEVKYFTESYSFEEVEKWFMDVLHSFRRWSDFLYEAKLKRRQSLKGLEFPFAYRDGQRDIAVSVYRTISLGKRLFIQAPTGVGKTMSTVFPAVKAVGEDLGDKLFYLTAKTITRTVAEEAFAILRSRGAYFRTITITAKEKVCMTGETECNPIACPYAKGHFDRVNDAVYDMITHEDVIDRDTIEEYAAKHTVCPFEFCLDASYWVDGIICDYNYVFDPNVYLKRYFSDGVDGDYIFLIDEAHNLVDRAREMYSAGLLKEDFLKVHKLVAGADKRLASALAKCNKELLTLKRECDNVAVLDSIGALALSLNRLYEEFTRFFEEKREFEYNEEVSGLFFAVRHFLNMNDHMQDNYVIYTEQTEEGFMLKLYCVNPSPCLSECLDRGRGSVFFSATLLPVMYYKELLSSRDDYAIYVRSPFEQKNRCLAVGYDVTSRYTRRNETEFRKIKNYIDNVTGQKKGNYMVFFPSYGYMESVYKLYLNDNEAQGIYVQSRGMKEQEREEFLDRFRAKAALRKGCEGDGGDNEDNRDNEDDGRGCIGFCVTGGVFSEGIDLKNESLIGCIIVGTGIPQICTERQLLRDYYDAKEGNGYDYAYTYPGMNKVMQAAGRVIRTMEDVGVILLLDERFAKREYVQLFPEEWDDYRLVNMEQAPGIVAEFWKNINEKKGLDQNSL